MHCVDKGKISQSSASVLQKMLLKLMSDLQKESDKVTFINNQKSEDVRELISQAILNSDDPNKKTKAANVLKSKYELSNEDIAVALKGLGINYIERSQLHNVTHGFEESDIEGRKNRIRRILKKQEGGTSGLRDKLYNEELSELSSFLCKQGLRDGEIGNILAKIEQGCEELEEKSLPHEEISTEYNSKKRKQDDKVHANSQDSEKKLREDVITSTNTFVDELYGNRIVKLDTSCLFGEENWEGIIKIFKLAADGQSSVPEATKKMIQGFYTICEDIGLGNLDQEFKLLILETLNTTSIHFDLYKADEQVIDNISATITRQMKEEETRNVLNQQEGLYIIDKLNKVILGLENQSKLKDNNYQIRLDPQIYHLQFRAIIIDVDREKCPVDYEFHEKIHLLDNNLLEGSLTCSAQALSHFNLDDDDKKVILENLIIKICQGFDKKHYIDTLYNAANGIEATACEVLAFALQKKALNPEFYKDKNFSLKEIKVMISIVDCFKNNISKKYPEMTGLTDLCQEFIDELNIKNSQPSLSPDILFAEQLEKFDQHQK